MFFENKNNYINPDNQTVLWNTINKSPLINNFSNFDEKTQWFKNVINHLYNSNVSFQKQNLSKNELVELNKQTIAFMINNLTPLKRRKTVEEPKTYNVLKKEITTDELFAVKQNEFNLMLKNDIPKEIDFSIKDKDEPVENIHELVEKHLKEREQDLAKYTPPAITDTTTTTTTTTTPITPTTPPLMPTNINGDNKTVHWKDPTMEEKMDEINKKLNIILNLLENKSF